MTLALHGKSRSRVALLVMLGLIAILGAFIATVALNQPASAVTGTVTVPLQASQVGSTNPGFSTGSCPTPPAGKEGWYGWHFVAPSADFTKLSVTFQNAGTISADPFPGTAFIASPDTSHAYVWTSGPDTLTGGTATVSYSNNAPDKFVLSHVCAPGSTSTNTPTSTPTDTPTNTPTSTPTDTPTSTPTPSLTSVTQTQVLATNTPTNTATNTPIPTNTNTPTNTPTGTVLAATNTPTNTATNTAVSGATNTPTNTPVTSDNTPANTPVNTPITPDGNTNNPIENPSPSISIIQGEKTPGPTPQAPRTGTGAPGGEGLNLLAAVAGLFALSAGSAMLATAKRRHR